MLKHGKSAMVIKTVFVVYYKPCSIFCETMSPFWKNQRVYVTQAGFEITTLLIYFSSTGITSYTITPSKTMFVIFLVLLTTNLKHILSFL